MPQTPNPGRILDWSPRDRVSGAQRSSGAVQGEHREVCGKTGAEERFYKEHMLLRTPMVVVTREGRKLIGWIEWYDRDVIKLHSLTEPNRFIPKGRIKYIYRHEEDPDFVEPIPTPPPLVARHRQT